MHPIERGIFFAVLTAVSIFTGLIFYFIAATLRYKKRKTEESREKTEAEVTALEKERLRIASDLHDDFGASLSALKLRLQCLEYNSKEEALMRALETQIDEMMHKVRRISLNIMPRTLQREGLREALNELIDMCTQGRTVTVNYVYEAGLPDTEKRVHIYRIAQELMNNIVKHSKATAVEFSVKRNKKFIELHIRDNGIGFDKNLLLKKGKGMGLQNIMARADLLNARVYLDAAINRGAYYLIEIPDENDNTY